MEQSFPVSVIFSFSSLSYTHARTSFFHCEILEKKNDKKVFKLVMRERRVPTFRFFDISLFLFFETGWFSELYMADN